MYCRFDEIETKSTCENNKVNLIFVNISKNIYLKYF